MAPDVKTFQVLQTSSNSDVIETPYIPRDDESEAAYYAQQPGMAPPRTLDPDDVRMYHMQDLGLVPELPDFSDVTRPQ